MNGLWPQIVLVVVLVLLNAAFAGSELALVSLREGQLRRLEQRSATGAVLARLARDPNRFMATIQVGITLAGFLASAAAAVSLSEPLEEHLDFMGGLARPVSIVLVTLVISYFTLVVGELGAGGGPSAVGDGDLQPSRRLGAVEVDGHARPPARWRPEP
jgi:putative hemolysin